MPSESPTCIVTDFNICYALDRSLSISNLEAEEIYNFTINITEDLATKAVANSVLFLSGVVEYGSSVFERSPLNISLVTVSIVNGLKLTSTSLGGTIPSKGITKCNNTLNNSNLTSTVARDIILIVSDGAADSAAIPIATSVKAEGIFIIPVFVSASSTSSPTWQNISSNGKVYNANFGSLNDIVDEIELC